MKKNLFLTAILALVFGMAQAQTEKGNQTLGFNLAFTQRNYTDREFNQFDSTSSVAKTKINDFSIGPDYSYFIADNLDLGVALQYSHTVENDYPINGQFGQKSVNKGFGGSVYLRKYFLYAGKIGVRTGPYIGYSTNDQKNTDTSDGADPANDFSQKTNTFNAGFNLDLVYFPSKRLGFAASLASLQYDHYDTKAKPSTNHTTGSDVSFNIVNDGLLFSVFFVFGSK